MKFGVSVFLLIGIIGYDIWYVNFFTLLREFPHEIK